MNTSEGCSDIYDCRFLVNYLEQQHHHHHQFIILFNNKTVQIQWQTLIQMKLKREWQGW